MGDEKNTLEKIMHPGAVCSDCGATMSEDEYSCGRSDCCGADVCAEEEYGSY